MFFLNAIFLTALPLLGIPIALHLLRHRQRQVVDWGAMQFLAESVTQKRAFQWLENLPLLLLRTAVLSAIVLALSQPLLRGTWLGTTPTREVVLVLDNSMSMARKDAAGTSTWNQLVGHVEEVLQSLSENDAVRIMLAAQGPHWLSNESTAANARSKGQLLDELHAMSPTEGEAKSPDCLQTALNLEPPDESQQRQIIVFTDRQQHGWMADDSLVWERLAAMKKKSTFPTAVQIVFCDEADESIANCAVTRVTSERMVVATDETAKLTAEIQNMGNTPINASTAEWHCASKLIATVNTPLLAPGQTHTVEMTHTFSEQGANLCSCRLAHPDDVELDNQASLVMETVDQIPVLYVGNGSIDQVPDEASWLFSAALGHDTEQGKERWRSIFRPDIVTPAQFSEAILSNYSVVFLSSVTDLSGATTQRLREFVFGGGGLWLTLGPRTNPDTFNSIWYDDGAGLSPLSLQQLIKCPQGQENASQFRIHAPRIDHPATVHLADTVRLDIDQVRLAQYFQFAPTKYAAISVLLANGVGQPIVVERYIGRGRVIVQSLPFDTNWSNWPSLKSFIVTIHDWLGYLSDPARTQYNLAPGTIVELAPPSDFVFTTAQITTPMRKAIPLTARELGDGQIYRYSQTEFPGTYSVAFVDADQPLLTVPFTVSRSSDESNLTPLTNEQQARLEEVGEFAVASEYNPAHLSPQPICSVPRQAPMWWDLLIAVLGLLMAELALSSRRSRSLVATTTQSFPSTLGNATGKVRESISL